MTENQKIFCMEYLKDRNGSRAYKVAYPKVTKDETARVNASRLLTNANVKDYINEQIEKMKKPTVANAQEIREKLTSIIRQELDEDVLVTENVSGVSEVVHKNRKASVKDAMKAIELLARLDGMFEQKTETDNEVKVVIDV